MVNDTYISAASLALLNPDTTYHSLLTMPRLFKDLLAKPNRVLNVFALGRMCHPIAIEMFGQAGGFDGLWFDQEHSGLTTEQILVGSIAARANGLGTIVRMPFTHYSLASQNLEAGVEGVMAARIASADRSG